MTYFVTGGTGFIGRFLIDRLVAREGPLHVMVRKGSTYCAASEFILNTAFRMFPDSGAAQGKKKDGQAREVELSPEQIAFAQITRGIHW